MKKSNLSEAQIAFILRQGEEGIPGVTDADCTPSFGLRRRAEQQAKLVALPRFEPTRLSLHTFGRVFYPRQLSEDQSTFPAAPRFSFGSGSTRHGLRRTRPTQRCGATMWRNVRRSHANTPVLLVSLR